MSIARLKRLYDWLFPAHAWVYTESEDHRECLICGRAEEFDIGSGFSGSAWLTLKRGDRRVHLHAALEAVDPTTMPQRSWSDSEYAVASETKT